MDYIYPPICAGCQKPGKNWCGSCNLQVLPIVSPVCKICGVPISKSNLCARCRSTPLIIDGIRAYSIYEDPLRKAIHQLKYKRNIRLGVDFSSYLVTLFCQQEWQIDEIIPMPLWVARKKQRGYNQASLLAIPLALELGIRISLNSVSRIRATDTQVDLDYNSRLENVSGAFRAEERMVKGKNILIIDDVTTSGATMNACASALKIAGANQVYGIALAKTISKFI